VETKLSSAAVNMPQQSRPTSAKHEEFKNQLIHDVFGRDNKGKVPMEKVAMLIWQFRDDPDVVQFMAKFVAKVSCGSMEARFDGALIVVCAVIGIWFVYYGCFEL
jgi:hypothetical protein